MCVNETLRSIQIQGVPMASFKNHSQQLEAKPGVYMWHTHINEKQVVIYIGMSTKVTLGRGVRQFQKLPFGFFGSKYTTLDANFIVGTAIEFIEKHGFSCTWEHIDDDPKTESFYCEKHKPKLQSGTTITKNLKNLNELNYWRVKKDTNRKDEAKELLFKEFERIFNIPN